MKRVFKTAIITIIWMAVLFAEIMMITKGFETGEYLISILAFVVSSALLLGLGNAIDSIREEL